MNDRKETGKFQSQDSNTGVSAGVNVRSEGDSVVQGDVVGRDKIVQNAQPPTVVTIVQKASLSGLELIGLIVVVAVVVLVVVSFVITWNKDGRPLAYYASPEAKSLTAGPSITETPDQNSASHLDASPPTETYAIAAPTTIPQSTRVYWGTNQSYPPGICVESCESKFIDWTVFQDQVQRNLLPEVNKVHPIPAGSKAITPDGIRVIIVDASNFKVGDVWFGIIPEGSWEHFDGLVRVGNGDDRPPTVWGTFQRYSDESYQSVTR